MVEVDTVVTWVLIGAAGLYMTLFAMGLRCLFSLGGWC